MKSKGLLFGLLLLTAGVLRADIAEERNKVEDRRVEIPPALAEEGAVQAVEKLGGKVSRDEVTPGKPVISVVLRGTRITNGNLKELAAFPQLQHLDLNWTAVTDAGLKELAALPQLQELALDFTNVTDAGLKELAALKQLHTLSLGFSEVTDMGVQELHHALPGCRIIH